MASLHDFRVRAMDGREVALSDYAGCVVLVVNTASACGFTPQLEGLQALYAAHRAQGLVVLGFPCNQFGHQEPGSHAEIAAFCEKNYGVTFPMLGKVDVNGKQADPLFVWLKAQAPGVLGTQAIKWNFTKFLIGKDGAVLRRYGPREQPAALAADIERALAHSGP